MTDPAHPIHRGGTLTGQKLRDAIMQQTEVVGGPGILVNYVNGKVVVSLKRQVVARVPGVAGVGSDVFMGKIMEVSGDEFNATYMVQNLAETITTLDSDPPGGCSTLITTPPGRCEGIPYVVPYNRFFDGGLAATPDPVLVDFHAAREGDWVMVGKVKSEVAEGALECVPPVQPGFGKCACDDGTCGGPTQFPGQCVVICPNGGTWVEGECCNPVPSSPGEPAEYAIWITEDVKISTCPDPSPALTGNVPDIATILPPPQLIGRVQ